MEAALVEAMGCLAEDNKCPICNRVTASCVNLACGHPVCDTCLLGMTRHSTVGLSSCPMCRAEVRPGAVLAGSLEPARGRLMVAVATALTAHGAQQPLAEPVQQALALLEPAQQTPQRWVAVRSARTVERGGWWPGEPGFVGRTAYPGREVEVGEPECSAAFRALADRVALTHAMAARAAAVWAGADPQEVYGDEDSDDDDWAFRQPLRPLQPSPPPGDWARELMRENGLLGGAADIDRDD